MTPERNILAFFRTTQGISDLNLLKAQASQSFPSLEASEALDLFYREAQKDYVKEAEKDLSIDPKEIENIEYTMGLQFK